MCRSVLRTNCVSTMPPSLPAAVSPSYPPAVSPPRPLAPLPAYCLALSPSLHPAISPTTGRACKHAGARRHDGLRAHACLPAPPFCRLTVHLLPSPPHERSAPQCAPAGKPVPVLIPIPTGVYPRRVRVQVPTRIPRGIPVRLPTVEGVTDAAYGAANTVLNSGNIFQCMLSYSIYACTVTIHIVSASLSWLSHLSSTSSLYSHCPDRLPC